MNGTSPVGDLLVRTLETFGLTESRLIAADVAQYAELVIAAVERTRAAPCYQTQTRQRCNWRTRNYDYQICVCILRTFPSSRDISRSIEQKILSSFND